MNLRDLEHRYKNAVHAHTLAVELTSKMGNNDDNASIEQAFRLERAAWQAMDTTRRELIGAYLERLGL